jgi:hypothetical protein
MAKSKPNRAEESSPRRESKREKATSSKVTPVKKEIPSKEQVKPETQIPCNGERKEICKEVTRQGLKMVECLLTCKVTRQHVTTECRCKAHMNVLDDWKLETKFRPPVRAVDDQVKEQPTFDQDREQRLKEALDEATSIKRKTIEEYEQMLKEKRSQLKPPKKQSDDSSSEAQTTQEKKN